jgi:hypothetical protein
MLDGLETQPNQNDPNLRSRGEKGGKPAAKQAKWAKIIEM